MTDPALGYRARTELAFALFELPPEGLCPCAVCGESPFGPGKKGARKCFGANFTDYDALEAPEQEIVCAGCERLLSGRPGDEPPPLRTRSVLVRCQEGAAEDLDRKDWWPLLSGERQLDEPFVLSWANSRKRHHWLHAGLSAPDRWEVGTDHGRASWQFDPALTETVWALLGHGCLKAEILAGHYSAKRSTAEVLLLDEIIAPLRGHLILDLVVWAAPTEDLQKRPERQVEPMIDPDDARTADLVAEVAWSSAMRVEDGIRFWAANGFLIRRLRRFAHRDLSTMISRLMAECGVGAEFGSRISERLRQFTEEEESATLKALRERPDLIAALAFDRVQSIREERKRLDPVSPVPPITGGIFT